MEKDPQKPEKFSDDPEEQLRIENELLKLKLKAETGGEMHPLQSESDPDLENAFLKNVIEFERQFSNAKQTTVFDLIGKPVFPKENTLSDEQVSAEFARATNILNKHNIEVDYLAEYPEREKYHFITEELFLHETDDMQIPGMIQHFIYEEFHPNHPLTITDRAEDFINGWFKQNFSEDSMELADSWITDQGKTYPKKEALQKFQHIFNSFDDFKNTKYELLNVQADVKEGEDTGLGFAEGIVKYDAIMENGETIHFEGPFKLYMQLHDEWWEIFFAYWPGLQW